MYSGTLSSRDRAGPALAVIVIHVGLAAMLLTMSGAVPPSVVDNALKVIDLSNPPPPPPDVPPPPKPKPKPKQDPKPSSAKPRAAAPPGKKAEASPIVLPRPRVFIPVPPPIVAAPTAGTGSAASQGAATAGSGSGAGGVGNGTGGGGTGAGSGGDGDDGTGTRPRPMFRPLQARGFPRRLVEPLPPGARVLIIFTVEVDGSISGCSVRQPSGSPELDALVCAVATQRFRYDPARRADGRPYVAKAAYMQVF